MLAMIVWLAAPVAETAGTTGAPPLVNWQFIPRPGHLSKLEWVFLLFVMMVWTGGVAWLLRKSRGLAGQWFAVTCLATLGGLLVLAGREVFFIV